jgi:acetyltransferase
MVSLTGYELILGSSIDPQFGPVILFGLGGQLVEVFKDKSLALPPLTTTLARRLMEETRIYTALKGVRGRAPVDLAALEQLLVRFSMLIVEQPWIKELDINPLLAAPERLIALDARVVLHDADKAEADLPKPAIRPYPVQYVSEYILKDGTQVVIRPIKPEDEPLMVKFHESLSDRTVYQRYLQMLKLDQRVSHERLTRICFINYDREMALVADYRDFVTGEHKLLGIGRMQRLSGRNEAEIAFVIADEAQGKGLGNELQRRIVAIAREEKVDRLIADILADNAKMQKLCERVGFKLYRDIEDPTVNAELVLA